MLLHQLISRPLLGCHASFNKLYIPPTSLSNTLETTVLCEYATGLVRAFLVSTPGDVMIRTSNPTAKFREVLGRYRNNNIKVTHNSMHLALRFETAFFFCISGFSVTATPDLGTFKYLRVVVFVVVQPCASEHVHVSASVVNCVDIPYALIAID